MAAMAAMAWLVAVSESFTSVLTPSSNIPACVGVCEARREQLVKQHEEQILK